MRGKRKTGNAMRAKVGARPPQTVSKPELAKEEEGGGCTLERGNLQEEGSSPPLFMPPLQRFVLVSRAQVLENTMAEWEQDE